MSDYTVILIVSLNARFYKGLTRNILISYFYIALIYWNISAIIH